MKMILFASALALGGVAYAQDATQPAMTTPAPSGSSAGAPGMAPPPAPATDPAATPSAMPPAAPDAMAPAPTTPDQTAAPAAAPVDDGNLPVCSKSVTDKCKEGGGMHHGMKHHKK